MSIVLNEREFAINSLRSGELGDNYYETLGCIAKYYKAEGYKKKEIRSMLESFVVRCDPTASLSKWSDIVDRQLSLAERFKLVEIDSIPITQKELDACGSLHSKQAQRLLFTLICVAKFCNETNERNNNWVNKPDKDVFRMANVVTPIRRQSLMLSDLRDAGFIRFSKKVDNVNINVLCIDRSGEPVMNITDFRNLGFQYLKYYGGPYFECKSCGIVVKRGSNVQKYCHECGVDMNRQNNRENYRNAVTS